MAVCIVLTVFDEDVLKVEHMLTLITSLGVVLGVCRSLIPEEVKFSSIWWRKKANICLCSSFSTRFSIPQRCWKTFLNKFIINPIRGVIERIKKSFEVNSLKCFNWNTFVEFWTKKKQKKKVFLQVYFLEELLSPFTTPIVLCFFLRRKSLQIIDFLRQCTIEVAGVGDVCSFSQLNVAKTGDLKVKFFRKLNEERRQNETDKTFERSSNDSFHCRSKKWIGINLTFCGSFSFC